MSWIFDRLSEIAVAEQVEVLLDTDTSMARSTHDSFSLAEVLHRAAHVPGLGVTILTLGSSTAEPAGQSFLPARLADLEPAASVALVERVLSSQLHGRSGHLRIEAGDLTCIGRELPCVVIGRLDARHHPARRVIATDGTHQESLSDAIDPSGLGVAIGGIGVGAHIKVDHLAGFISILDVLVALRSYAFNIPTEW